MLNFCSITYFHITSLRFYNISAEDQVAIILNHELLETHAKLENDSIYLEYQFVHDMINPRFYWDANENILLYATERYLYSVNADKTSYQVNKANTEYGKTIVRPTSDSAYIELDFVNMFSFSSDNFHSPAFSPQEFLTIQAPFVVGLASSEKLSTL